MLIRIFLLLLLIVSISSCDSEKDQTLAEIQLSGIREDLDLWGIAEKRGDQEFKQKVAISVVRKTILLRSLSPDLSSLNGEALEAICLLDMQNEIFNYAGDEELESLAKEYLSSIIDEAKFHISEAQKNLKGEGCYLTPESKL